MLPKGAAALHPPDGLTGFLLRHQRDRAPDATCQGVGDKEKTLTVFPTAPLKVTPSNLRRYPITKLGAPGLELTEVVADLAQSMRIKVVCDGPQLVAAHLSSLQLTAVRASYEELASSWKGVRAESRFSPPR